MLLAEVVDTWRAVAATRSRTAKVGHLAGLLRRLDPSEEVVAVVGWLSGQPRQGRVGVGWATLSRASRDPAAEPSLTVLDLDRALERLEATAGAGSGRAREDLLGDVLSRATEGEQELVRRILLRDMGSGALAGIVTDAVAKAAGVPLGAVRRAAMLDGDLGRVAEVALAEGEPGLSAVGLTVGRFLQPMLASTAASVAEALDATGEASVEWKLDGARVQVHRSGPDVTVWTRNGNDVTGRLPGIVAVARSLPVRTAVLDGEAVGLADGERPDRFQDTMSRFGTHGPEAGAGLAVRFFDCLHHDGVDLLDEPLASRLEVLVDVAAGYAVPSVRTADPAVAEAFLDGALALGHEGVMVKDLRSRYEAGRRGGAWRKVKPVHTLDLVVLAAEWGYGRRTGWLSNLHLGASDASGGFVMVGKTFKGLTDELLRWQTDALLRRKVAEHGIVVEVRPELVVEVAVDGVQRSTRYPGGVALRFARVRRYRDDKGPEDADTVATVRAMLA